MKPTPITFLEPDELDKLKPHPLADLFPALTGDDYLQVFANVGTHGVTNPITLLEGEILDGRMRVGIARQLRMSVPVIRFEDIGYTGSPLDYAIAQNVYRGHYTTGQRSMIASKVATMRQGERTDLQPSALVPKVSQEAAAKMLNVSVRSVGHGRYILEHGSDSEIEDAVRGVQAPKTLAAIIRARIEGGNQQPIDNDSVDRAVAKLDEVLTAIGTFRGLHVDVADVVVRLEGKGDLMQKMFTSMESHQPEELFADFRAMLEAALQRKVEAAAKDTRPKNEPEVDARRKGQTP
jgi:hypothetical protein